MDLLWSDPVPLDKNKEYTGALPSRLPVHRMRLVVKPIVVLCANRMTVFFSNEAQFTVEKEMVHFLAILLPEERMRPTCPPTLLYHPLASAIIILEYHCCLLEIE